MINRETLLIVKAISGIIILVALAWLFVEPGFEPALATLAGLVGFISPTFVGSRTKDQTGGSANMRPIGLSLPLSQTLEDALAIAKYQSRLNGKPVTSTKYVFAAIRRVTPDDLRELLEVLENEDALPPPISEEVIGQVPILTYDRPFSGCIKESLTELGAAVKGEQLISASDLFVDVAKHGRGSSVARLREHGVDATRIDELVVKHQVPIAVHRRIPNHAMQRTGENADR